ncbi:MAG TPA: NifB/NifX family molybdenum-iron cluster-binding protein [Chitinispirillaceae bacterium]|nr:NifB/NifX family molybdenum-iron cluster-binding protein [Chitinispirillaceae bacterium]
MKICMPVASSDGKSSELFGHFGSAPFFAIYDSDTDSVTIINNGVGEHEHGQCMPVNAIQNTGAEAVICKGMGLRAANLLSGAGIKPYLAEAVTVNDAILLYKSKKVIPLDESRACQHHGCHH